MYILGTGILQDIVESGAKGSVAHISRYIQLQNEQEPSDILIDARETFDKFVCANAQMKMCGRQQSGSNSIYQNVFLLNGTLFCNETVLVENIFSVPFASMLLFRPNVIRHSILEYMDEIGM